MISLSSENQFSKTDQHVETLQFINLNSDQISDKNQEQGKAETSSEQSKQPDAMLTSQDQRIKANQSILTDAQRLQHD